MDHGIEHGPKDFPAYHLDPRAILEKVVKAKVDAIMIPRGLARITWDVWAGKTAVIVKLTGKTTLRPTEQSYLQTPIATVKDAVALGADGVAVTIYWGAPQEHEMIKFFTQVAAECEEYGIPLLNLAYPRGPQMTNKEDVQIVRYASRAAAEIGADIIKTYWTGSKETFAEVVKATPIPVLMSGGAKAEDPEAFLRVVKDVMEAGGAGVVVGRNIFQTEKSVEIAKAIGAVVHKGLSVEEALRIVAQ
jgi:class I fructose-bisphosphate aldolase